MFENVPRRRSWPQRELNPCLDRERVASLPLDDGAKWSQRDSNPCFRLERAASSPLDDGTIGRPAGAVNYSDSRKPVPIASWIVPRDALRRPPWVREIYLETRVAVLRVRGSSRRTLRPAPLGTSRPLRRTPRIPSLCANRAPACGRTPERRSSEPRWNRVLSPFLNRSKKRLSNSLTPVRLHNPKLRDEWDQCGLLPCTTAPIVSPRSRRTTSPARPRPA